MLRKTQFSLSRMFLLLTYACIVLGAWSLGYVYGEVAGYSLCYERAMLVYHNSLEHVPGRMLRDSP